MPDDRAKITKLIRQAKDDLTAGRRDEALILLKQALAIDPGSSIVTQEILNIETELTAKKKKSTTPSTRIKKIKPTIKAETEPEPEPEPEPEFIPESEIELLPDSEIELIPESEIESIPESEIELLPDSEIELLPDSEIELIPDSEIESIPESEIESEPLLIPEPWIKEHEAIATPPPPETYSEKAPEKSTRKKSSGRSQTGKISTGPREKASTGRKTSTQTKKYGRRPELIFELPFKKRTPGEKPKPKTGEKKASKPAVKPASRVPLSDTEKDLQKFFNKADKALASGNESIAMSTLREAEKLYPTSKEIRNRLDAASLQAKAHNHVRIGTRELKKENTSEALKQARIAFSMSPLVHGLEQLITILEKTKLSGKTSKKTSKKLGKTSLDSLEAELDTSDADLFIRKVREKIQISALAAAAKLAKEGLDQFPDNRILTTFVARFKKMGL